MSSSTNCGSIIRSRTYCSQLRAIVIKAGEALLSFKVDSWQNGVDRNVDGRTVRRVLG